MEAHVQVISRETIKPSPETPHHLRKLKFSYLDQLAPPMYVPLIFFYQADKLRGLTCSNHLQISQKLKQSLSNTLTSFYPLSGRIEDNFFLDCSDAGVEFIEAQVHSHLLDVIKGPNMDDSMLRQYLPVNPASACSSRGEGRLSYVQITFFDCGGIAFGLCILHKIADFSSIMAFLNAWAATCRGEAELSKFSFDLASYFPARENLPGSDSWEFAMSNEKFMTKRLVFDKKKLAALEAAALISGSTVKDPTRVELVSAFIWKHFMEMSKRNSVAIHGVNLRTRKSPPQSLQNVFGNSFMLSSAFSNTNNKDVEAFHELVSKLRGSIRKIDDEYITKAQSGDNYMNDLNWFSLIMNGELELCPFSSWCRFPVYEVDYGWGNPTCFCTATLPVKNLTNLVTSKCGEGIEAWVNMEQDNLEMLETKIKLISTNVTDMC